MNIFKYILIVCSFTIITGFAVANMSTNEAENLRYVDQIPIQQGQVFDVSDMLESEDAAVRETTEMVVKERHIEVVNDPEPQPKGRWVWATVTAYEPSHVSCGIYADGKTSTNVNVMSTDPHKAYGFAVDPSIIPYGTEIYVPGYWESLQRNRNPDFRPVRPLKADDTGSAMRRSGRRGIIHIDVRFRTIEACRQWGVRRMKVFIYD